MASDQEAVEQARGASSSGRWFEAAKSESRGRRCTSTPAAVHSLIQHREQVVEDRPVGVEELVQEDELCLGQHPGRDLRHGPLAEAYQVDRAENLVRLGEACSAGIRSTGPGPRSRTGRSAPTSPFPAAVQEQVLTRDDRQGDQVAIPVGTCAIVGVIPRSASTE